LKEIEFKTATVSLRSDNIIEVHVNSNLLITKAEVTEIVDAIGLIGSYKKYPVLIIAGEYSLPDSNARPYLATPEANKYTIAVGFVIKNTAQKLMANVYLKIDKPLTPTQFFTSDTEAVKWLLGYL